MSIIARFRQALSAVRLMGLWRPMFDDLTAWEEEDQAKLRIFFASSTGKRLLRRADGVAARSAINATYHGTEHASGNALGQISMVVWLRSLSASPAPDAGPSDAPEASADAELDAS